MSRFTRFLIMIMILPLAATGALYPGNGSGKSDQSFRKDARVGAQVFIPPGIYRVGGGDQSDHGGKKQMKFNGFYIDIHPVTNLQYIRFMELSGYLPRGGFEMDEARCRPRLPATGLTYDDARAFAEFHRKRLPTEWEWEIAAGSLQDEAVYATGSLPTLETGNFFRYKQKNGVTPVFSYPPNKLGLFGMAGNVFEWTSSEYPAEKLSGPYRIQFRIMVLKGGAWTNIPHDVRVTTRTPFPAGRSLGWLGFRCVSDRAAGPEQK
jgi:formylglycine-generating enzyme required for sulfatase activity